MQGKKSLVVLTAVLAAVIGAAALGYNALGGKGQGQTLNVGVPSSGQSSAAGSSTAEGVAVEGPASSSTDASRNDSDTPVAGEITLADFTVQDRQGEQVKLSSQYGKPTIVTFWATWCPPCNAEAPVIQKLYDQYGDRINFMMIDSTDGERDTPEVVEEWIAQGGYTYPIYLDVSGEASTAGQVYYLPTTYVLSPEGDVWGAFSGGIDEESGEDLMQQIIALAG